ncbi:MAG: ParB/RepB/Spo0J family partition protein [Alsobacter sp.]
MRPISTEGFKAPDTVEPGPAPMLQWVKVEDLVVDPAYQRLIRDSGRKNVQRIAAQFRWSCFAPVVVAPIEGGKYAIIDGQHRTTAALLAGVASVPCLVIIADRAEQALAFKAINGSVTKVSRMAMHAAAVVAGEPAAALLQHACAIAEVELLRYPIEKAQQQPGQTMSIQACAVSLAQYGRDTLITALQCVTQTGNNVPGILSGPVIRALCAVMDAHKDWRDAGEALFQVFEEIDISSLDDQAGPIAAGRKGSTRTTILIELLEKELSQLMDRRAA